MDMIWILAAILIGVIFCLKFFAGRKIDKKSIVKKYIRIMI